MKWWLGFVRCWLGACLLVAFVPSSVRAGDEPLRVVFVGNSYTYSNDLPSLFRALVRSQHPDREVHTEAFVMPGGALGDRWRDGVVQQYLKDHPADVLVLQELGSWLRCADHPSLRTTFACTDSLRAHKRFAEFAARLGVRTVLLGTWSSDVREQFAISRVSRRLAKSMDALPADVGDALLALRKQAPEIEPFTDRMLHPSPDTSMLAAIMLYARIEGWLPKALAVEALPPLIDVSAQPDARRPLSSQDQSLPHSPPPEFNARRMQVLIRAAAQALEDDHR